MTEDQRMQDEKALEAEIVRVLEQKPVVAAPVDFAARVRAALPPEPKVKAGRFAGRSLGRMVGGVAAVALVVALCVLAPHARPSFESLAFDLEMVLLLELAGVAIWLGKAGMRG
jgi:hypothetical protein